MMEMDYQVDEVDAITGPAMGHPSSASFGTVDLVGLDVLVHVVDTLERGLPGRRAPRRSSSCPSSSAR